MKKAKLRINTVYVRCPYCNEDVENPFNGSFMWDTIDIKAGESFACSNCDEVFEIPKNVNDRKV